VQHGGRWREAMQHKQMDGWSNWTSRKNQKITKKKIKRKGEEEERRRE
jgi:hypothetical protein